MTVTTPLQGFFSQAGFTSLLLHSSKGKKNPAQSESTVLLARKFFFFLGVGESHSTVCIAGLGFYKYSSSFVRSQVIKPGTCFSAQWKIFRLLLIIKCCSLSRFAERGNPTTSMWLLLMNLRPTYNYTSRNVVTRHSSASCFSCLPLCRLAGDSGVSVGSFCLWSCCWNDFKPLMITWFDLMWLVSQRDGLSSFSHSLYELMLSIFVEPGNIENIKLKWRLIWVQRAGKHHHPWNTSFPSAPRCMWGCGGTCVPCLLCLLLLQAVIKFSDTVT